MSHFLIFAVFGTISLLVLIMMLASTAMNESSPEMLGGLGYFFSIFFFGQGTVTLLLLATLSMMGMGGWLDWWSITVTGGWVDLYNLLPLFVGCALALAVMGLISVLFSRLVRVVRYYKIDKSKARD